MLKFVQIFYFIIFFTEAFLPSFNENFPKQNEKFFVSISKRSAAHSRRKWTNKFYHTHKSALTLLALIGHKNRHQIENVFVGLKKVLSSPNDVRASFSSFAYFAGDVLESEWRLYFVKKILTRRHERVRFGRKIIKMTVVTSMSRKSLLLYFFNE